MHTYTHTLNHDANTGLSHTSTHPIDRHDHDATQSNCVIRVHTHKGGTMHIRVICTLFFHVHGTTHDGHKVPSCDIAAPALSPAWYGLYRTCQQYCPGTTVGIAVKKALNCQAKTKMKQLSDTKQDEKLHQRRPSLAIASPQHPTEHMRKGPQ
jgi:hypothetical protein